LASKRQPLTSSASRETTIEERRDHFLRLDQARGPAFAAHRAHFLGHPRGVGAGARVDDVDRQAGSLDLLGPHLGRHFERRLEAPEGEVCGRFIVSSLVLTLTMWPQALFIIGATRRAVGHHASQEAIRRTYQGSRI
jgi:hypothetical protein